MLSFTSNKLLPVGLMGTMLATSACAVSYERLAVLNDDVSSYRSEVRSYYVQWLDDDRLKVIVWDKYQSGKHLSVAEYISSIEMRDRKFEHFQLENSSMEDTFVVDYFGSSSWQEFEFLGLHIPSDLSKSSSLTALEGKKHYKVQE